MRAVGEAHMVVGRPRQIEGVGIREDLFIPIRGGEEQGNLVAGGDRLGADRRVACGGAPEMQDRRVVAKELLHRA